jgi:hypothetical protein
VGGAGEGGGERGASSTPGASSAGSTRRRGKRQQQPHSTPRNEEEEEDDDDDADDLGLEPGVRRLLEMQLLHHFVTVVSHTFSAADNPIVLDVWTKLVPRTALAARHAFLLNTVLAFSALHFATTTRERAGGFDPVEDTSLLPMEMNVAPRLEVDAESAYRIYLGLAFRQQREAIRTATPDVDVDRANALLFSSLLLSYQALHVDREKAARPARGRRRRGREQGQENSGDVDMMGTPTTEQHEDDDDDDEGEASGESVDGEAGAADGEEETYRPPVQWLRMVRGIQQTTMAPGRNKKHDAVVRFLAQQGGEPNFLDPESLTNPRGIEPFAYLLDYARCPEPRDEAGWAAGGDEDGGGDGGGCGAAAAAVDARTREAYEKAVAYVGTVRLGVERGEDDRVLFRRMIGFGFATPDRFIELVDARRPRALVIVACHLSMASRLGHHWLFRGVAEREVRGIRGIVPAEWRWAMRWPMDMLRTGAEESRRAGERARARWRQA